jgi:hypothetical protein
MTIEALLIIAGFCLFACYLIFEWQKAAIPPYQEPVALEPDLAQQWVQATKADTLDNIDNWNAKVGDKIWHKEDKLEPTVVIPQAVWPFPGGPKP